MKEKEIIYVKNNKRECMHPQLTKDNKIFFSWLLIVLLGKLVIKEGTSNKIINSFFFSFELKSLKKLFKFKFLL